MTTTFTRDGKSVEYDPTEEDAFQWTGDPQLTADILDVLATGSVTLGEPGPRILFYADAPLYNAVAAAMSLGCDIEGTEEDDLDPSVFEREITVVGEETIGVSSDVDIANELSEYESDDGDIWIIP